MMSLPRALALYGITATTLLAASGCSMFTGKGAQYREAGVLPLMVLPEGVNAAPTESAYVIPEVAAKEFGDVDSEEELVIPRPSPMSQDSVYARVKIQKVGERRWILAEAPTSQVWPLVQSFLARNGILVARAQPKTGTIETGWLTFKVDASSKSRYKLRIEKGVRENSSEVHVLHQQVVATAGAAGAADSSAGAWPNVSSDPDRESWMLDELAVSIAQGISNRAASLLGQAVGGDDKITLRRDSVEPVIDIRLDAERTQATLAHALSQEGMKTWAEEAQFGLFYFGYDDPNEEPGLWRKMTFRGDDDLPDEAPAELRDLLATMAPEASSLFTDVLGFQTTANRDAMVGYLLRARTEGDKVVVRVRDSEGQVLPYPEAKKLLVVIRRNLI